MPVKTVDVREAQMHLPDILALVSAGTEIVLHEGGKAVARILPVTATVPSRVAGLHPGAIRISDDFDEPLSF